MVSKSIKDYSITNPPPVSVKFGRTKEIQTKYDDFMKDKTIDDIIKHINTNILNQRLFRIVKNDFPYNVPYEHYLLWISPRVKFKVRNEFILKYVKKYFKTSDFICFENLSGNKSILDIRHFHIFKK